MVTTICRNRREDVRREIKSSCYFDRLPALISPMQNYGQHHSSIPLSEVSARYVSITSFRSMQQNTTDVRLEQPCQTLPLLYTIDLCPSATYVQVSEIHSRGIGEILIFLTDLAGNSGRFRKLFQQFLTFRIHFGGLISNQCCAAI